MSTEQENLYSAPESEVEVKNSEGFDWQRELASRWTRLGAYILDSLFFVVLMIPLFFMGFGAAFMGEADSFSGSLYGATFFLTFGISMLIGLGVQCYLLYKYSQTLGKRMVNIKIVRTDGSRANFPRLFFLRMVLPQIVYQIPMVGGILALINALFIFGQKKQCIHDLVADTYVIDVNPQASSDDDESLEPIPQ